MANYNALVDDDEFQKRLAIAQVTNHLMQQRPELPTDPITSFENSVRSGFQQPFDAENYLVKMGYKNPSSVTRADAFKMLLDLVPGIGDVIAIDEGATEWGKGNKGMAALNFASAVPAIGDAAKLMGAGGVGLVGLLAQMGRKTGKAPVTPFSRQAGVIGYHGSPHKFDAFDIKHLGSGEGAQAYGHGLYFAENPEVAKTYASVGETIGGSTTEARLAKRLDTAQNAGKYTEASVIEDLLVNRSPAMARARFTVENGYSPEFVNEANKIINELSPKFKDPALYKVDIPDEYADNFLDWDKPLSEQPNVLKNITTEMLGIRPTKLQNGNYAFVTEGGKVIGPVQSGGDFEKFKRSWATKYNFAELTGRELIDRLGSGDSAKASEVLNKAGIKGIRYLDQGSREAGKGTSNFVVFDDKIIKILERK